MNQERRVQLFKAKGMIINAIDVLKDISNKEEIAFDNLSDGLQQTMRGQQMEDNIDNFNDAINGLKEMVDLLDNII